jgi:hypothetical protein
MLASLVRIFKRLSKLIFDLPGEKLFGEGVSKTFLPIMNVNILPAARGRAGTMTGDIRGRSAP